MNIHEDLYDYNAEDSFWFEPEETGVSYDNPHSSLEFDDCTATSLWMGNIWTGGKWIQVGLQNEIIVCHWANNASCGPTWDRPNDFGYNLFIFSIGFFLPVSANIWFSRESYRCVRMASVSKHQFDHFNV